MVSTEEMLAIIDKDMANRKPYWEGEPVLTFEEVSEEVTAYLEDTDLHGGSIDITWAPLSDTHWELVAFAPGHDFAVIDSIYASPETAKAIRDAFPEVGQMELE